MKLDAILEEAPIITEEETKKIFEKLPPDHYQLLDVRLHEEYEDDHLPGAILVPLPDLMNGDHDLDPDKLTLIYCRSGRRSCVAGQYLLGQGFKMVYDISTHIMDWLGIKACGDYDLNLNILPEGADFKDAWNLAYAMEDGLQRFYIELERREQRSHLQAVFHKLASFEDLHKERLLQAYASTDRGTFDPARIDTMANNYIEGCDSNNLSITDVVSKIESTIDIFSISLAIEAQALDLYARLSRMSKCPQSAKLFMEMAFEERGHMAYVSEEMEKQIIREQRDRILKLSNLIPTS